MRKKLYDISNKIDPLTLDILTRVSDTASSLQIDYFIVGALARNIFLNMLYNVKIYRATNDIDFSVKVRNWEDYSVLIEKLIGNDFAKTEIFHRFTYKSIPGIDIIPFGKIALNSKYVKWPDKNTKEMTVIGFEECFNDSVLAKAGDNPEFFVRVASLRGFIIMKLISWKDGFPARSRYAQDIFYILMNYIYLGNSERLFNMHGDLVNDNFDYELTGAILAGRVIKAIVKLNTLTHLKNLIDEELNKRSDSQLIKHMCSASYAANNYDKKSKQCLKLLYNLRSGLD